MNCDFWGPKMTRKLSSEADIQHTYKCSSHWYVNKDWHKTSGNCLRKWPKYQILTYLGDQIGPKIGSLRPISSIYLKVLAMSMWSNIDVKPMKTFLRKWPKTGILTYFGAQSGPKIGSLRPIFHTSLKVLAMSMWSNTDVKPVKTLCKSDERPERLERAYKARLMWMHRKLFSKIVKNLNFDSFGGPKLLKIWPLYTPTRVAPTSL